MISPSPRVSRRVLADAPRLRIRTSGAENGGYACSRSSPTRQVAFFSTRDNSSRSPARRDALGRRAAGIPFVQRTPSPYAVQRGVMRKGVCACNAHARSSLTRQVAFFSTRYNSSRSPARRDALGRRAAEGVPDSRAEAKGLGSA